MRLPGAAEAITIRDGRERRMEEVGTMIEVGRMLDDELSIPEAVQLQVQEILRKIAEARP
ncbi:MAG TPA: hypothetical protein VHX52_10170 [Steroidobacteraceae bacterium]|jgi:hypothetical protein|nr:hypothetical protein [Steroidobacteraceae bacterium]